MASRIRPSLLIAGLVTATATAVYLLRGRLSALTSSVSRCVRGTPPERAAGPTEIDGVEEASLESFPASDPPPYGPGL